MSEKKVKKIRQTHKHGTERKSHELVFIRIGCLFFDLKSFKHHHSFDNLSLKFCPFLACPLFPIHFIDISMRTCAYLCVRIYINKAKSKKTLKCVFFFACVESSFILFYIYVIIGKSQLPPRTHWRMKLWTKRMRCRKNTKKNVSWS